jgi:hypothetical protein
MKVLIFGFKLDQGEKYIPGSTFSGLPLLKSFQTAT